MTGNIYTIVTRKEAKLQGLVHYFTNKECKHGHIDKRLTVDGTCCHCKRLRSKSNYYTNYDSVTEYKRKWNIQNPNYHKQHALAYYQSHKDERSEYSKEWKLLNKAKTSHYNNKRRAAKLNATVVWANECKIKELYAKCTRLNEKSNIQYQVDHIYPLQGDNVCGLHVENNLQIITSFENMSKSNKIPSLC